MIFLIIGFFSLAFGAVSYASQDYKMTKFFSILSIVAMCLSMLELI